jgi:citrate synthase
MWLTAQQALAKLKAKPQSLYASVSRGRIRAKPDPADSRRSLYNAEDVERLAARSRGRRSSASVAAEAISWGEPVLASALTTIAGGRLYYRGVDAVALSETADLETVATLLWGQAPAVGQGDGTATGWETAMVDLANLAAVMPPSQARPVVTLRADASETLTRLAASLLGGGQGPLHLRLAAHWRVPAAADLLRRALVLLADHELNASTFAARVTVSTGASLAAGTLAGLAALGGPRHGRAAAEVAALAEDIGTLGDDATHALRDWLGEGRSVPGFGHRLYPDGDIRARALLRQLELPAEYLVLQRAAAEVVGDAPNVDFALAAISRRYALPDAAPTTLFALARAVGWLAHMIEQAGTGTPIRPRARYIGPAPGSGVMQHGHNSRGNQ